MNKYEIRQMTVPKNDGSNQRKQVFPQTHPDAVIGLPEWQLNVQNALESIMGTNLGENRLSTVVHKSDLKNLVDKKTNRSFLKQC
ncbi:hypothetical protein [Fructilactobacillus fructivorans]|uniref:hypothetical protein n=1 Tax=Fructilactobacillus fructivorans TaxID=1614 RepID=UPI0007053755|nr:hypothetical protein [Fructilactobacillus fructivorans]